jgi:hypothetical protein
MNSDYIQTIARNLAQLIAGLFVAKGALDKSNAELISAGVASVAVAVWGVWHQWKHRDIAAALTTKLTETK